MIYPLYMGGVPFDIYNHGGSSIALCMLLRRNVEAVLVYNSKTGSWLQGAENDALMLKRQKEEYTTCLICGNDSGIYASDTSVKE